MNKGRKKVKKGVGAKSTPEDEIFNFDNEIVIGVTKKTNNNVAKTNKKNTNKKSSKSSLNSKRKTITNSKKKGKASKKKSIVLGVIKWTILLLALVASFIFFMMSPLFNLVEINIVNNNQIDKDTILSLSQIKLGDNIYKNSTKNIVRNIKENPYIDSVKVSRKLPNKIDITVEERIATFMLEYANSYVYINNQGYILEISENPIQAPIIVGYDTTEDMIKPGNRLIEKDLNKLSSVLKIMESANSNNLETLITKIDISNKQNYTLIMEKEQKVVYLGDASNLSNRMLYLKIILEKEKGIEGEVFIEGDLKTQKAFFRPK